MYGTTFRQEQVISDNGQENSPQAADHTCKRTHGTVEDLLSLIPAPAPGKEKGDPFITLSSRATKAWLALFAHARAHGTWQPRHVDPLRPELTEEQQYTLTAHWTVAGLAWAMGVNRDTAGKALQELTKGGWMRRENPRNKGQFGGIDYSFGVPTRVTQADKAKVAETLRKRGVEFRDYEWRTATRVLADDEIERVQQDVELNIEMEQADLDGNDTKATELASMSLLHLQGGMAMNTTIVTGVESALRERVDGRFSVLAQRNERSDEDVI